MSDIDDTIDWSLTTYDGSRREQMRRAAEIPFDRILDAIEEMGDLAAELAAQDKSGRSAGPGASSERRKGFVVPRAHRGRRKKDGADPDRGPLP